MGTLFMLSLMTTSLMGGTQEMTDVTTYSQVAAARRNAALADPMKRMAPSHVENPAANRPKDILEDSDVLCFQGVATLVPKRAILRIPKGYTSRVGIQPGARIVSWRDFITLNRGWITTVEVSWKQAGGEIDIAADTRKVMDLSGNLVVATYKGGPISVLPLKQTETAALSKP